MAGFQTSNLPPIKTNPLVYTPGMSNATGITTSLFQWWRDGVWLHIQGRLLYSGAGESANWAFALPTTEAGNPVINPSLVLSILGLPTSSVNYPPYVGTGLWFDPGVAWKDVYPIAHGTTTLGLLTTTQYWWGSLAGASDMIQFDLKVPISGW